jgi:CspA family cold shock protein
LTTVSGHLHKSDVSNPSHALKGIVKWFSAKKGYGFLVDSASGQEVFVHHTAIRAEGYRELTPGAEVQYSSEWTQKGSRATEVLTL